MCIPDRDYIHRHRHGQEKLLHNYRHTERFESTTKGSTGGHSTKLPTDLLPLAEVPCLISRILGGGADDSNEEMIDVVL